MSDWTMSGKLHEAFLICQTEQTHSLWQYHNAVAVKQKKCHLLLCLGCTWTFEIVSMLLAGNVSGLSYEKGVTMIDAKTAEDVDMIPSPRIVNAHLPFEKFVSYCILQTHSQSLLNVI